MPKFVRVLRTRNDLLRTDADGYLPSGEVKADAFNSFRTSNGKISLFRLDSDGPQLARILAAFALTRQDLKHVDYVLLSDDLITKLAVSLDSSKRGITPDDEVNAVHADMEVHTARKLFELVCGLWESQAPNRYAKIDVLNTVQDGIRANFIDRSRIGESMERSLSKGLRKDLSEPGDSETQSDGGT